jgi:hypothetical protein
MPLKNLKDLLLGNHDKPVEPDNKTSQEPQL